MTYFGGCLSDIVKMYVRMIIWETKIRLPLQKNANRKLTDTLQREHQAFLSWFLFSLSFKNYM